MFDSIKTLPGLLPAVYRGLEFHVADTSTEAGRRVLEYLFPGVNPAAYDDFGVMPQIVTIDGIVVGDDYQLKGAAFLAAFERPGSGLLIHPWLGPMNVIMEEPAEISYSSTELRMLRIRATLKRVVSGSSFLGNVVAFGSALIAAVSALGALAQAMSARPISHSRSSALTRSARLTRNAISTLNPPRGSGRAVSNMRNALTTTPDPLRPFTEWLTPVSKIIEDVAEYPAVSPAATALLAQSPSAHSLLRLGVQLSQSITLELRQAPSDTDRAILSIAALRLMTAACSQIPYADFQSRTQGQSDSERILSINDQLTETLENLELDEYQGEITTLSRALQNLNVAILSEINAVIGRLPKVLSFKLERLTDAYAIALHVAGDRPELIERVYADIVRRNRPIHSAQLEAGTIEVLDLR